MFNKPDTAKSSSQSDNFCSFSNMTYLLDFYGKTMDIQISGKNKMTTVLGAFLGFISMLTIIVLSIIFVSDLFKRKSVSIMYNQDRNMIPLNNFSHTPIIFKMTDGTGMPIDNEGVYEIDALMAYYMPYIDKDGKSALSYKSVKIPYSKCNINTSFGEYRYLFTETPFIDQLFCIAPESNNLTLFGKYADMKNGFSFLNVFVNKCVNTTTNVCLDESVVNSKLANAYFAMTFMDYQIDHNNSTNVASLVMKTSAYSMNYNILKRYFFYVRQVFYFSDDGYIFQDYQQKSFYQQDNYQFDVRFPGQSMSSSSNFGMITITNENKVDMYYRTYTKVQQVVANIGGVFQGILICFTIVNYIFTRNYTLLHIVNSSLEFEEESEGKSVLFTNSVPNVIPHSIVNINPTRDNVTNSVKHITKMPIINNKNWKEKDCDDVNKEEQGRNANKIDFRLFKKLNSCKEEPQETRKNKSKKLKLNFWTLLIPKFCIRNKAKIEILENSENILREYLSLENIVEKFYEIEKIKNILLESESKFNEFNFLIKPQYKEEMGRILNKIK